MDGRWINKLIQGRMKGWINELDGRWIKNLIQGRMKGWIN